MRPHHVATSMGLLLLLLLVVLTHTASAGVTEVQLPSGAEKPLAVAVDAEGNVWATLDGSWAIAKYEPSSNQTTLYNLRAASTGESDSLYSLAIGPDGSAWTASQTHLHQVTPAGEVRAHPLPAATDLSGGVHPMPDGTVWVALVTADKIVAFDPETGEMRTLDAPSEGFGPLEWSGGEGDALYLTGTYGNSVTRLDTSTGTFDGPPEPFVAAPTGIARAGSVLWIGEHGGNNLMRFDPATGAQERFPTAASPYYPISGPSGVVVAPDGAVWFAVHFADRVSRLDPETRTLVEYEVPSSPGTNMQRVALDPNDRVWFGEWSKNRLGYATYGGETPDFDLPNEVNLTRGASVRIPFAAEGKFRFGTPYEELAVQQEGGELVITADPKVPTGPQNVLVSELDGKTYVGKYVRVNVNDPAPTPGPGLAITLAALAATGLIIGRRWRL